MFFDPRWYDPEVKAGEALYLWKRIGKKNYMLIYDYFGLESHNFGFSETSDFVNFTNLGCFNEGVMKKTNLYLPKHETVIQFTRMETEYLAAY